jgi:hypothetical protein
MLCRHCGRKISLLRRLTDTEFCSDRHRADFLELEREAALARLAESGARIIPREPPPTRKGSQKQPKAKDEIPAPLAGILREPCLIPKTKRKILTHTRMMGWTLIQELPQLTLTVQARRMDLAGGMPMEFHPARLSPLVQNGLSEPAEQPGGVEETDVPPVAGLAMIDGLAPVLDRYDYILIDCPPSLGLLTLNGLVAGEHGVIIPVQCEYLALEGLTQLTQTIERVRHAFVPGLRIRGVILTMYDGRTNLANDVVQEVRRFFPDLVFNAIIPRSIRLAEAPSFGQPISVFAPTSSGALAYAALAREILVGDGIMIPDLASGG